MTEEIAKASAHGWDVQEVTQQSGHINVGRTLLKGGLTLGVGYLTGASRTKGVVVLRFIRSRVSHESPAASKPTTSEASTIGSATESRGPLAEIEKLAELHKTGVLTDEEFANKKKELLSRL